MSGKLSQCDGLVLDLRDGWGGASLNYLNLFRPAVLHVQTLPRKNETQNITGVWGKPVSLLTNRGTTSGKELFALGFKKLKLGQIVGETTAGAVVAGGFFLLKNGDVLYLAVTDIKVDGKRLEGVGVEPDIKVGRPIRNAGPTDPQLERAIELFDEGATNDPTRWDAFYLSGKLRLDVGAVGVEPHGIDTTRRQVIDTCVTQAVGEIREPRVMPE